MPINIVPAAKRLGAAVLEFAVPEFADVVSDEKTKTPAKSVGRQSLRKRLGISRRERKAPIGMRQASRVIPTNIAKQTSRA